MAAKLGSPIEDFYNRKNCVSVVDFSKIILANRVENQAKHKVSFPLAQNAFLDPHRIIVEDINHSSEEERFYCIVRVGDGIMTVRFTYRGHVIHIYGAGYWRRGRKVYEEQNKIY